MISGVLTGLAMAYMGGHLATRIRLAQETDGTERKNHQIGAAAHVAIILLLCWSHLT